MRTNEGEVAGVGLTLASGTAGVEPSGGTKKVAAAIPEALEPGADGEGWSGQEMPPQVECADVDVGERGGGLPVAGIVPALAKGIAGVLSLLAGLRRLMSGRSNAQRSTCTNEEENCWLQALHLPWPRVSQASSLLAGLREPPLQNSRRWSPGNMAG